MLRTSLRVLAALVTAAVVLVAVVTVVRDGWDGQDGRDADGPGQRRAAAEGRPRVAPKLPGEVLTTIGVVSYNALRHLPLERARRDWDRLTGRDDVDLIGWQESKSPAFRRLYPRYRARGWETWHWPDPDGPISLAVSWRTATFELLDVSFRRMHRGGYPRETTDPFPARWVVTAQLRHRATGRTVTLLNTHVNQHIETGERFERNLNAKRAKKHLATLARMWDTAPGSVVLGTGDYNFDFADDSRAKPAGGITRAFRGHATSTYQALGLDGLRPTRKTRWIDYVFVADRSLRRAGAGARRGSGTAQIARHRVLGGYASDHAPLLARIRVYR
jgi:endonuclease/exonuclease/phosphatase family metal-dependent hydrolase